MTETEIAYRAAINSCALSCHPVGLVLSWRRWRTQRASWLCSGRFRQARPHWNFAAELLLKAAETGKRRDVEAATAQMERALRVEGWW